MSLWSALRCGGLRVVHGVEHGLLVQYQRFERLVRNVQARIVPEPHVYLSTLAVDPEHQGRGHGRELMKAVLEQAEQAGRVCYLETELERNVGFYRRFGFEVADELVVPGTTVVVRAMIRRPVLGSGAGGAGSA